MRRALADDAIATTVREWIDERFTMQSGPDGTPWAPLDADTVREKGSALILQQTGRFRRSFQVSQDAGSLRVRASTALGELARALQAGAAGRMPARPIFPTSGLPAALRARIAAAIRAALREAAAARPR